MWKSINYVEMRAGEKTDVAVRVSVQMLVDGLYAVHCSLFTVHCTHLPHITYTLRHITSTGHYSQYSDT